MSDIKRGKDGTPTKQLLMTFRRKFREFRDVKLNVIELRKEKGTKGGPQETALSGDGPTKRPKFLPEDLLELDRKLVSGFSIPVSSLNIHKLLSESP